MDYNKNKFLDSPISEPCRPSPCGPNSICRVINGQSVCSCALSYIGTPPGCRPECTTSSECATNKACINQKCENPCPTPCGKNTDCTVKNHSPYCTCKHGFTGEPFSSCFPVICKKASQFQQFLHQTKF